MGLRRGAGTEVGSESGPELARTEVQVRRDPARLKGEGYSCVSNVVT